MDISTDQLLALLGAKEVELHLLRQRIAALEEAVKQLPPKPEAPQ